MRAIAQAGRARLRDYGGAGPPVIFVPSLINPPDILDLDGQRSLLRWLAGQGFRPLLLDWGFPAADERDLSVADHVQRFLLPLVDQVGPSVTLAGYCLGGTMALAAAALRPVRGLALIATPWRFGSYPAETLRALDQLWEHAEAACAVLGVMPMEVLQTAFWQLDPGRPIRKYEAFGALAPDDRAARAFVRLEDWANDGPPLTYGVARELFVDLFRRDVTGRRQWRIVGQRIDPASIRAPVLEVTSTTDHIAPACSAAGVGARIDLELGHVGMIVGRHARRAVWEPLAEWLSRTASS
ncbi:alpha/beta fold hydrolase [uncultured Sphingomonas sp.]|uniref:alpha/beta fold hydrolase n=1 Tax=uncultured Sphingomonas sp. TaxID=158754 RepID=UPI00344B941F